MSSPEVAFRAFANHLGRVSAYRALALDDEALDAILRTDNISPSGQLKVSAEKLAKVVETHGVRKVMVARLYISQLKHLIGHDPSLSLHDDWQTMTIIASGYSGGDSKKVHLFKVSVPVVESLGWTLRDVSLQSIQVLELSSFHDASFDNKDSS